MDLLTALDVGRDFPQGSPLGPAPPAWLDTLTVPNITLPNSTVQLGLGDPAGDETGVAFDTDAGGFGGAFSRLLEGLPWQGRSVWTRACLGEVCGAATRL